MYEEFVVVSLGSGMGNGEHGGGWATATGKCSAWRRKPPLRPPLGIGHSSLQLLHHLLLPHKLSTLLRRRLRPSRTSRSRPLQPPYVTSHQPPQLAKRLSVVRDRPWGSFSRSLGHNLLSCVQETLPFELLFRRALLGDISPRHVSREERKPVTDVDGLVTERATSKKVHTGVGDGGVFAEDEE